MGTLFTYIEDKMPEIYSYNQYEQKVNNTNTISKQLMKPLKVNLQVDLLSLKFNYNNWKNSEVKAILGLFPQEHTIPQLMEQQVAQKISKTISYKQSYSLKLTLRQLYQINDLFNFCKQEEKNSQLSTPKTPFNNQNNQCDICFDQTSDLALPCGHVFGAKCISQYIIQKDEKKCPKCRQIFIGSRSSIERKLYIVVDNQESIYDELRCYLLQQLKKNNEKTIDRVMMFLARESKHLL